MQNLDQLKIDLGNDYSRGMVSDSQYKNMINETSELYQEIYKKKIDALNKKS